MEQMLESKDLRDLFLSCIQSQHFHQKLLWADDPKLNEVIAHKIQTHLVNPSLVPEKEHLWQNSLSVLPLLRLCLLLVSVLDWFDLFGPFLDFSLDQVFLLHFSVENTEFVNVFTSNFVYFFINSCNILISMNKFHTHLVNYFKIPLKFLEFAEILLVLSYSWLQFESRTDRFWKRKVRGFWNVIWILCINDGSLKLVVLREFGKGSYVWVEMEWSALLSKGMNFGLNFFKLVFFGGR